MEEIATACVEEPPLLEILRWTLVYEDLCLFVSATAQWELWSGRLSA
jgi:hypothetical protein